MHVLVPNCPASFAVIGLHKNYSVSSTLSLPSPLSLHVLPRAPIPKGRLLEIIASLQRASERQCSNLTEHQQLATEEQELHSPPQFATPTSSPTHCDDIIAESANGSAEDHISSYIIKDDVIAFEDKELQKSSENPIISAASLAPLSTAVEGPQVVESGSPPLAPPPPPLAPPPPPPPSAPGLIIPQRVVQYEPNVPLKPLFWKKLRYSAMEVRGQDIVWSNTSEPG